MNADVIRELLEARPMGAAVWIRVHGRSMYPLLRSGDSLRVLRCEASELRRGDVGIALRPDGILVAHLVESVAPVVLTSFLGTRDPEGTRVLGRAVGLRTRVGVEVPFGGVSRAALLTASRAARWLAANPTGRSSVRAVRESVSAVRDQIDRRRSGAPAVRVLTEADVDAAYLFVQDRVSVDFDAFASAVRGGEVSGVFVGASVRALRLPTAIVALPDGVIADRTRAGRRYARMLLRA